MIAWESDVLSRSVRGAAVVLPEPAPAAEGAPLDSQAVAWRRRLWRELTLAGGLYGVAHYLFSIHTQGAGIPVFTLGLAVAQGLFLLGTLLLWRVTRTLNDPAVARHPAQPRQAACCLAIAMALSFSPCVWWFIFRL